MFLVLLCVMIAMMPMNGALASVMLPAALTTIQAEAFEGDGSLNGTLSLPSKVSKIGAEAFKDTRLYSLWTPAGLKEIGNSAFRGCTAMTLICEDGLQLESIGEWAFGYCSSLTGIDLGESLVSVGTSAFRSCISLEEIHFPASIESFGRELYHAA